MRSPQEKRFAEKWSEEPVVCGAMTSALAAGAWPYGTAALHAQSLPETVSVSQSALRDVYGLPFEIAANSCRAAKLPDCAISGQRLTENSPLLRAWLLDCGYGGMLWGDETLRFRPHRSGKGGDPDPEMDAAGKKAVKNMEEAVKSHCNQQRKLI